jgi:hypothetical protein
VVVKSEAPTGEPKAPLVLPAKSQSGFLESIDKNTGEIQQLTAEKTLSAYKKVFCSVLYFITIFGNFFSLASFPQKCSIVTLHFSTIFSTNHANLLPCF